MKAYGFLLAAVFAGLLTAADERVLNGRVLEATTGDPVAHARVTLRFYQIGPLTPETTVLSDTDGSFRITNMPSSGFQISADKAGYLPTSLGMGPLQPGDDKSGIVLRLQAQAALEGTVVDERNMPMENASIQLVRQQVINGRRQFQVVNGSGTDESGYFRAFGLAAGRYYISVAGRLNAARRSKPLAYPQFFYPNASELAAAQPVDLKAGDDRQIKIKLPDPIPAFEVRGVVASASQNVSVRLVRQPFLAPLENLQASAETNWDPKTSTFKISHVTPGMYLVNAQVQEGRTALQASTVVTVGNADIAGLRLEPAESVLDGTVRMEGAAQAQMFVSLESGSGGNGGLVGPDGKFHILNLRPETYRVVPQIGDPQSCIRSVLQGGRDVRDGLTIIAGLAPAPVDIVITNHCGSIDATITPPDGGMPPNVVAVLLRKTGDEYALEKQTYVARRTNDSAVHVLMQGVAAGNYLLFAWPQDQQIEYSNAEYMRQFESYGQSVTVAEDNKTAVTLDKLLIPGK